MNNVEQQSDFGRGLVYCIGLFLAHASEAKNMLWIDAASDHLFELETLNIRDKKLKREIEDWREKVLNWRHGLSRKRATEEQIDWAIEQAKTFLYRIDKKMLGVDAAKARWE